MQIVIDIPEDIYDMCKKYHQKDYFGTEDHIIRTAIAQGVIIPQDHGRLIDADEYKEHLYACETNGRPLHMMELNERLATVDDAPTILEALY